MPHDFFSSSLPLLKWHVGRNSNVVLFAKDLNPKISTFLRNTPFLSASEASGNKTERPAPIRKQVVKLLPNQAARRFRG
jgi:hypothetical protein